MSGIASVYNYYISTFGKPKASSKYEAHKKSELKDAYNRMVKANRESPLYKIDVNDSVEEFALSLKERARETDNVVSELSVDGDDMRTLLNRKIAESDDPDAIDVEYIGDQDANAKGFSLSVKSLAEPETIEGNYLRANGHDFREGDFSFDLDTANNSYEFQFGVEGGETNEAVQQKIARLMNRAGVGIHAEVVSNGNNETALKLTSSQTGLAKGEDYLFRIQSGSSWNEVHRLGLDTITSPAKNAEFTLNGKDHHALSNQFTINNAFEIRLKAPTEGTAKVGFKANTDAISDSVQSLADAYNAFADVGRAYREKSGNARLFNEVTAIARTMSDDLGNAGLSVDDEGRITLDRETLSHAVTSGDAEKTFDTLNSFKHRLSGETKRAEINPMRYVNKLVVEYKNPGRTFSAPYAQSLYAGLLVDQAL